MAAEQKTSNERSPMWLREASRAARSLFDNRSSRSMDVWDGIDDLRLLQGCSEISNLLIST